MLKRSEISASHPVLPDVPALSARLALALLCWRID
jgi:hypothetical protein